MMSMLFCCWLIETKACLPCMAVPSSCVINNRRVQHLRYLNARTAATKVYNADTTTARTAVVAMHCLSSTRAFWIQQLHSQVHKLASIGIVSSCWWLTQHTGLVCNQYVRMKPLPLMACCPERRVTHRRKSGACLTSSCAVALDS